MTYHRPNMIPDAPLTVAARIGVVAAVIVLLGGWLMLSGCSGTDWGLADPDWTPPAESRAAGLVEPDIDPRHPGDTATAGDVVAAPRALVEVTPGQVAAMESAVRRWIRAAPPGCFADPPPAPLALRDWREWLTRCHRVGNPPPAGAWPHADLFRHWSTWSRSGQWHWQTISPRLTEAFSRSAFASWCGPDPNRPSRDRCDARALYSEADVQRALGGNPGPGPGPVDPPPPANPCPGWEPWPPPEGADSCVSWTAPDFPPECGYSPPGPFDRGPVCNGRFRDGGEPPPPPGPVCGDGTCSEGETQATCPVDCGTAPPPPPPPPSGDCDLSPVVQRQDALIAELSRLREALADRPPLVCPEPVCNPAPCRLDCDCPGPCPNVDCGGGEPEPPDPTDPPPPPTGETLDTVHHYPGYRKWTLPPGRYRTTIEAASGPDAPHWQDNAQIVVLVVRAEHRWELQYRVAKDHWVWITNHQARELPEVHSVETVTGVLIDAPDGLIVEVGIPPEVEAKIGPKWAHWGPGEGWRAALHFSPASEARSFALWPGRDEEPMTLPEKLEPVRWGEGAQ